MRRGETKRIKTASRLQISAVLAPRAWNCVPQSRFLRRVPCTDSEIAVGNAAPNGSRAGAVLMAKI